MLSKKNLRISQIADMEKLIASKTKDFLPARLIRRHQKINERKFILTEWHKVCLIFSGDDILAHTYDLLTAINTKYGFRLSFVKYILYSNL